MSYMFWMCMKCGKHLKGSAQEISDCAQEHMCEADLNASLCNDCATNTEYLPLPPPPTPPPSTSSDSEKTPSSPVQ